MKMKKALLLILITIFFVSVPYTASADPVWTDYPNGIQVTGISAATMQGYYNQWKGWFIVNGDVGRKVRYPEDGARTISEGMGYAMILAAYYNDQALFDDLWRYKVRHQNGNQLLPWLISTGNVVVDPNTASDADFDIAFALVAAHRRWGSTGAFNYNSLAQAEIGKVRSLCIDSAAYYVRIGAGLTTTYEYPSYYQTAFFREFDGVAGGNAWWVPNVIAKCHTNMAAGRNATTGLIGDIVNHDGTQRSDDPNGASPGDRYKYNSCRMPWRMAIDYVWNGTAQAKTEIDLLAGFFDGIAPASVVDGYYVGNGASAGTAHNGAFTGPAACSFMGNGVATAQTFLNNYYSETVNTFNDSSHFYSSSLALLSMTLMTGHMPRDFGLQQPTPTPRPGDLLDDCEDGDNTNNWDGPWYTFIDTYGSTLTPPYNANPFPMTAGGVTYTGTDTELYSARIAGYVALTKLVGTNTVYPFVGLGTGTNAQSGTPTSKPVDLSMYEGIRFYVKNNEAVPAIYHIKIQCPVAVTATGDNDYRFQMTTLNNKWQQVTVPWTAFAQLGIQYWGIPVSKNLVIQNVTNIQWQTDDDRGHPIDLWIDDVELYPAKSPTPVPTYCVGEFVDDLEDGDHIDKFGGYWFSYKSVSSTVWPNAVTATFTASAPGANGSDYAARITGTVAGVAPAFCGVGVQMHEDSALDIGRNMSVFNGIEFWAKGNPGDKYKVKLCGPAGSVAAGAEYYYDLKLDGTWQNFVIPYSVFKQPGWAPVVLLSTITSNLVKIQWESATTVTVVNFWVDDVVFRCSLNWTPTPTRTTVVVMTSTNTRTPTFSRTPSPTSSGTFTRTSTPTASRTVSASPTGTNSSTLTSTATFTPIPPTSTITSTFTPVPPTSTFTGTRTASPTFTRTASPTDSPTTAPSSTFTGTRTVTPSFTNTNTRTVTATNSFTRTITPTFTITNTHTVSPTLDLVNSATPTYTSTESSTRTPSFTATVTDTQTDTNTWTPSSTQTSTMTQTPVSTATDTYTIGSSPTFTNTVPGTLTFTRTATTTPFVTPVFTSSSTATVTLTSTNVINTPTATETPATPTTSGLLDDVADCNNLNNWGGYWYTYNDSEAGGTSEVWPVAASVDPLSEFIMSSPGRAGAPDCAARLTGVVTKLAAPGFQWGFVAMGIQVGPNSGSPTFTSFDFSSCEATGGITFWAKGDGKSYSIKLKSPASVPVGDASYEYSFTSTAAWTQYTVYFNNPMLAHFAQPSWVGAANIVPIGQVLAQITDVQFQTVGQPLASIDLWIDDIEFFGCAAYPTPPAATTPTNTPVVTSTNTLVSTVTGTPVNTNTNTPAFTATNTLVSTVTNTPVNTPVNTNTNTPVNTSTNTRTITPTFTITNSPTQTHTVTNPSLSAVIIAPADAIVGGQLTIIMSVNNNGNAVISNVMPSVPSFTGSSASLTLVGGPTPSSVVSLAIGDTVTFTWVYDVTGAGTVTAQGTASGNAGAVVSGIAASANINLLMPTSTATPVGTNTPTPSNIIEVVTSTPVIIRPNPNPTPGTTPGRIIDFTVTKPITKTVFKIYTSMGRLIRQAEDNTPHVQGKCSVSVDGSYFQGLAKGIYYYVIIVTDQAGKVAKSPIEKVVIQ